jgi:integrase
VRSCNRAATCGHVVREAAHYIVLSRLTGARTEELRALRWEHVHIDGQPHTDRPGRRTSRFGARFQDGRRQCSTGLPAGLALVPGLDPLEWTPCELRHSFVSVLSDAGVPVE